MQHQANPMELKSDGAEYRVVDLAKIVRLFWRRRFVILTCAIAGAVLAAIAAFLIHPAYDATVRLMPPQAKESLLASLSSSRNEGDLYLGLVNSRTVTDDVIDHQNLREYFHTTKPSELRRRLGQMAKISVDKDQFLTVTVRSNQPETSLRIANEFPEALSRLNDANALADARHRWQYYKGPLDQEKVNLAEAEEQLRMAQQKTGIVLPEAQAQLGLAAIAALKQQIMSRQEQLAALETSSTNQNPQVIQLKSQIGSLSGQLSRLQAQNGGAGTSASKAATPALTLEVERRAREVKYHQTLFEILSRQYENAKVDESYSPPVQLIDRAVLPDEKSWPPRKMFYLIGFFVGMLLGIFFVWMRAYRPLHYIREQLRDIPAAVPPATRI